MYCAYGEDGEEEDWVEGETEEISKLTEVREEESGKEEVTA
jgi:hypothetical protein